MTSDSKKPGVAFCATVVVVVVLAAYPLAYGPFLRLYDRLVLPRWTERVLRTVYRPLSDFVSAGPPAAVRPYQAYLRLWRSRKAHGVGPVRELWVDSQCRDFWNLD